MNERRDNDPTPASPAVYGAGHQRLAADIRLTAEQAHKLALALRSADGHSKRGGIEITSVSILEWEDDNYRTCVTAEVYWAEIGEIRAYTLG